MSMVSVDINQLNRAIIKVGSRASLASRLGKGASYISYVIESGEMEEELAEKIAVDYNIDVILGDTRVLGIKTVSKTTEKPSKKQKYDFGMFFEDCCVQESKAEVLFSDLYVIYSLFQIKEGMKSISRSPFERTLRLTYGFTNEDRIVYDPFPYMDESVVQTDNFKPNKRTVVKGITLKKQAVIDLVNNGFYEWADKCCEKFEGDTEISQLFDSYNKYFGDHCNINTQTFTSLLTFIGIALKTTGNTHKSTLCHGLKLKSDPKKKAVINDLYGIKQADLTLKEINPLPQEQSIMEQLLAEQRRTNDLLEDLISIWK